MCRTKYLLELVGGAAVGKEGGHDKEKLSDENVKDATESAIDITSTDQL